MKKQTQTTLTFTPAEVRDIITNLVEKKNPTQKVVSVYFHVQGVDDPDDYFAARAPTYMLTDVRVLLEPK